MLEKVKTKAKEITSNEKVQLAVGIGSIVALGLTGMYFVGYASGMNAGVNGVGKVLLDFVDAMTKAAEKAV